MKQMRSALSVEFFCCWCKIWDFGFRSMWGPNSRVLRFTIVRLQPNVKKSHVRVAFYLYIHRFKRDVIHKCYIGRAPAVFHLPSAHRVGSQQISPFKGLSGNRKDTYQVLCNEKNVGQFPKVMEDLKLGSSGKLVRFICTHPGTSPHTWFLTPPGVSGASEGWLEQSPSTLVPHWSHRADFWLKNISKNKIISKQLEQEPPLL